MSKDGMVKATAVYTRALTERARQIHHTSPVATAALGRALAGVSMMGNALKGTILAQVGTNMLSLFVVFGLLYWVSMARLVRGQILSIKTNEYVLAARALGAKPGRIIRKHILPNCISVIFISVALQIPSAIFTESFLSFIGLGVQAPMPSLGSLANAARGGMQNYPWKMLFPALSICLIVLSFNLLGDGLRDAFDPKLRR